MRLFLAIPLPSEIKARLRALQESLESPSWQVRWTPPENFHLTLHFLGETPENLLKDLHHDFSALAHARRRFDLSWGGIGAFPNWEDPRVVWAGVQDPKGSFNELGQAALQLLKRYRLFKLRDEGIPHLTLGRVSELKASWDARRIQALDLESRELGVLPVEKIVLFKSEAGKYFELETFLLT